MGGANTTATSSDAVAKESSRPLGADEDDFHHFSRQRGDVERERMQEYQDKVSRKSKGTEVKSTKVVAF